jgi:hypothetical protein
MMEQEEKCYVCDRPHEWGENLTDHYITNHFDEVTKWYLYYNESKEEIAQMLHKDYAFIPEKSWEKMVWDLRGTRLMLKRAQEIGKRDALIINNIKMAMIGEEGEWVDLLKALIQEGQDDS